MCFVCASRDHISSVAMRNPFIAAVAASAGTIVVMGGATLVVSSIGISVAKRVVARRKVWPSSPAVPVSYHYPDILCSLPRLDDNSCTMHRMLWEWIQAV